MLNKILLLFSLTMSLASAEPSDESIQAADSLTEVIGIKNQMKAGFNAMLPIIEQQSKQLNLNESEANELKNIYKNWFENDLDHEALSKQFILLYAEAFTVSELKDLTTFYKTDLGKKVLTTLPQLMAKGAQLGAVEGQKKQHLLLEKIKPFLEKIKK